LIELFVIVSLRGTLDIPGYVVCAFYFLVDLTQFLKEYVTQISIVRPITGFMIWIVLYYFVYEMRSVHLTLTSEDPQENLARQVKNRRQRNALLSTFIGLAAVPGVVAFYFTYVEDGNYWLY